MTERLLEVEYVAAGYGGVGARSRTSLSVLPKEMPWRWSVPTGPGNHDHEDRCGVADTARRSIRHAGANIGGLPSEKVAQRGIAYVPEDRRMFADLTVRENIAIARRGAGGHRWSDAAL